MTTQELESSIKEARERGTTALDFSGRGLTDLPESIGQLFHLERLDLSRNHLAAAPANLGKLRRLRALNLSGNRLTTLPPSIGELTALRELYLYGNQLDALPEGLGRLTSLETLSLCANQITVLPDEIGQLVALQALDVSSNLLAALPETIGQLSELRSLYLSSNRLREVPESLGWLAALQTLFLSSNRLGTLPESFGCLTKLQKLTISVNQLTHLPGSLGQLENLQTLGLSGNRLTHLPESLGQLENLQTLGLSGNRLAHLPLSIGHLAKLEALHLDLNQLTGLPKSLLTLTRQGVLRELFLHGNTALGLPPEVLGPHKEMCKSFKADGKDAAQPLDVLQFYFRAQQKARPLNEAKLILVGRGEVGKTCIANRLVRNVFQDTKQTNGIRITPWPVILPPKEEITLHVWDFGGQEIMHATHQFFLTQRSLYLLVLAGRAGGEDSEAEYWLQLIESFGGDSPVIVVLNKIGEHPFDLNRGDLQAKHPAIREFVRIDCKDGQGLEQLHAAIRRETHRLEGLRASFPAAWFSIKEHLAGLAERGENLLTYEQYRTLCAELGEREARAQETLAVHLHSLGVALNYKDDPRLNDMHVLSPHWVTNGIYKILNWHELAARNGVLRLHDLAALLPSKDYHQTKHVFLLDLMRKFEMCFEFPNDPDNRYLVPQLLGKDQPGGVESFPPTACLNFQYHYNLIPEGLLPRFIVRTQSLSEGLSRWRTGVILRFGENTALVKADLQARKIFVSVAGPLPGRRCLLAVIRSDFERIHADIKKLQVIEMVPIPGRPTDVVSYRELLGYETHGIPKVPRFFESEMVEIDVRQMLDGVDMEGTRNPRSAQDEPPSRAVRVFISYSHKDEALRGELDAHLKLLQRLGRITSWIDRRITAGEDWAGQIDRNLEEADLVLLLVSSDFINSDYCYKTEMTRALERSVAGQAVVIPIIVRPVDWASAPFSHCQALPKDGFPIVQWPSRDEGWTNVALGIRNRVETIFQQG